MPKHPFPATGEAMPEAGRYLTSAIDDLDETLSLLLAADMAVSELDGDNERRAIKSVLYAARDSLRSAYRKVEASRGNGEAKDD